MSTDVAAISSQETDRRAEQAIPTLVPAFRRPVPDDPDLLHVQSAATLTRCGHDPQTSAQHLLLTARLPHPSAETYLPPLAGLASAAPPPVAADRGGGTRYSAVCWRRGLTSSGILESVATFCFLASSGTEPVLQCSTVHCLSLRLQRLLLFFLQDDMVHS